MKDTLDIDITEEQAVLAQLKKDKADAKKNPPKKEEEDNKLNFKPEAILPTEKKKPELKDTLQ